MPSLLQRLRRFTPQAAADRRNITALAIRLGTSEADATWLYRRSREVGFGAASQEFEEMCRDRQAPAEPRDK